MENLGDVAIAWSQYKIEFQNISHFSFVGVQLLGFNSSRFLWGTLRRYTQGHLGVYGARSNVKGSRPPPIPEAPELKTESGAGLDRSSGWFRGSSQSLLHACPSYSPAGETWKLHMEMFTVSVYYYASWHECRVLRACIGKSAPVQSKELPRKWHKIWKINSWTTECKKHNIRLPILS